jgi:hypothetical protein
MKQAAFSAGNAAVWQFFYPANGKRTGHDWAPGCLIVIVPGWVRR